jgi:hypothetical protein
MICVSKPRCRFGVRVFGVPSLVSLVKNGGNIVGSSGGVNCLSARGWKFGVRDVREVVFSRYSEEEILRCWT